MKVLILGATGFIGFPIAQAFVRNGHEVFGQTRSASKALLLSAEEIVPVIADPSDGEAWADVAGKADVVIDTVGGPDVATLSATMFKIACEAAKKARLNGSPKLIYIYCSGTWVHGHAPTSLLSERTPITNPTPLVAWRPAREQAVLNVPSDTPVDGIVIRPSILYGRSGSILAWLFGLAGEGKEIVWPGRKDGRWALVHADDLARLFVSVAEASPICKGLVFDATNDSSESVEDVLKAVVRVSGSSGYKLVEPSNAFEEALSLTSLLRPSLARALVGWRPLKPSLVDGIETYYIAAKAAAARSTK